MSAQNASRIVLFPYDPQVGWYECDLGNKELTHQVIKHGGGDVYRTYHIDPKVSLEAYIKYIGRIREIGQAGAEQPSPLNAPLVVLTRTFPINLVFNARKLMTDALPGLRSAVWIVCVDNFLDVSFEKTVKKLRGSFDRPRLAEFPIWTTEDQRRFLVVTPESSVGQLQFPPDTPNQTVLQFQFAKYLAPPAGGKRTPSNFR